MARENPTHEKCKDFALRILRLCDYLEGRRTDSLIIRQLGRSGTSIGANFAEAMYASSRKDFLNKCQIALKECAETEYWLGLLHKYGSLSDSEFDSINGDCTQLLKILVSICRSTAESLKKVKKDSRDD